MKSIARRTFLKSAAISLGAAMLPPLTVHGQTSARWVFVGTFTNATGETVSTDFGTRSPDAISKGLYSFSFDEASEKAGPVQLAAEISSPANLTMHSNKRFLYAGRGQNARINGQSPITAFAVKPDGTLRELNSVPSGGQGPSVGVVDSSGRNLLTTNWSSSSIVCVRLNEDGTLGERTALIGRNPETQSSRGASGATQQEAAASGSSEAQGVPGEKVSAEMLAAGHNKPHAIVLSRTERYAIAAEINSNRCHVMRFDTKKGSLETHAYAPAGNHCGPRHLMFHPSYRWLYTSGEEGSFVSAWRWDEEKGSLEHLQQLSTLPDGYAGPENHPADVRVHPGGKFVYVSNRSTGTIAGYAIDQNTGALTLIGQMKMGSPSSWGFIFDNTGKWAIVSEQIGDAVRIYSVNQATGQFRYTGQELKVVLPICVRMT